MLSLAPPTVNTRADRAPLLCVAVCVPSQNCGSIPFLLDIGTIQDLQSVQIGLFAVLHNYAVCFLGRYSMGRFAFTFVFAALLGVAPIVAQTTSSEISGTVLDPSSAVIAGAKVTLQN